MNKSFVPIIPFTFIQGIRLAHALMESSFKVHIPEIHADKFIRLKEAFGANYQVGIEGAKSVNGFEVTHEEPLTCIGGIKRPLIFPHAILRRCLSMWVPNRDIRISFSGLVTGKREALISDWCRRNALAGSGLPKLYLTWHKMISKIRQSAGFVPENHTARIGDLHLCSSSQGRTFPVKSWDAGYFGLLARSRFVLCPSGDYVWTYRFFESVLCGAIPVVEEPCKAYEGFIFKTFGDPLGSLVWDQDAAEQNYQLCVERISVPVDQINEELEKLIHRERTEKV